MRPTAIGDLVSFSGRSIHAEFSTLSIRRGAWLTALVLISLLLGVVVAYYALFRIRFAYRTDIFFGVRWQWQYDWKGRVQDLRSSCPNCGKEFHLPTEASEIVTHYDNQVCRVCGHDSALESGERFPFRFYGPVSERIENAIRKKIYEG
jgi:ribosomal protein S27AE